MAKMNRFGRWLVNRRTESRARRVLAKLGSYLSIPPNARVLELGSGGGGLLALLHEQYHPERLVGTDFDLDQVTAAQELLSQRWGSLPPSIALQRADALTLPFPETSFDAVFAMMMLHHVEERHSEYVRRPQALKEIRRVLRPGGMLVYSDMFRRKEIRSTLSELGFIEQFLSSGWRTDFAIFRAPG